MFPSGSTETLKDMKDKGPSQLGLDATNDCCQLGRSGGHINGFRHQNRVLGLILGCLKFALITNLKQELNLEGYKKQPLGDQFGSSSWPKKISEFCYCQFIFFCIQLM